MDNTETFHNKKRVVAGTVGFIFEADPFKSVTIVIGFGCHGQHRDVVSPKKAVAAETVGFSFEAHLFKTVPMIF